jgi:uncharacterized protein YndB with AHSA1/START domain
MKDTKQTLEFKFERTIPAPPDEVFAAWLDPKIPGNPWHTADKLLFHPHVDGFFYWLFRGTPHYGRFTEIEPAARIQHTWMSPNTLGQESTVTVTFEKKGANTLMTLVHSDLPIEEKAKSHEKGWTYFLDVFFEQFGDGSRKEYRSEDAHPAVKK